jgi:ribosomal protein L4
MLQNIGLNTKKTLIVIPEKNEIIEKSIRNVARTKIIQAMYVNPVDLLHYDKVLVFASSLEKRDTLFA